MDPNQTPQQVVQQNPNTMPPQQSSTPPQESGKKKYIIIGIVVLVLLLIASIIVYFLMAQNNNTKEPTVTGPTPTVKPTLIPFPEEGISENTLIIRYREGSTPEDLRGTQRYEEIINLFDELGVVSQEKIEDYAPDLPDVSYVLTFKEGVDIEEAAQKIHSLPEVDYAEPDPIVEVFD